MTLRIALIDDQTGEFTVKGQRCKVVPVEPVAWASANVIPLRGIRDNFPCILTPFKCDANTVPLLSAAAIDLSSLPVVPEREILHLYDRSHAAYARGFNAALDAIGVKG